MGECFISLPAHLRKARLRRTEAVEYLAIKWGITLKASTMAKYASLRCGPAYDRFNRSPMYRLDVLDAWAASKLGVAE